MEEVEEAPIHGDILEAILSHVPLIHLLPASHVSKTWNRAVLSSLRYLRAVKPWLIIHSQATWSPFLTSIHAFDPRSRVWIDIQPPCISCISALRASHSDLLYMVSPSKIIFPVDPFLQTWHEVDLPLGLRADPIVATVGNLLMIAGGDCNFPDDLSALEIYDLRTRRWEESQPIPEPFRDSLSSVWLSVAVDGWNMYISDKSSGVTYSFNPSAKTWCGPYDLRPDKNIFFSVIGFVGQRLILVALLGDVENISSIKIWEVNLESFDCEKMSEMPMDLIQKLKGKSDSLSSIEMTAMDDLVFIHNQSNPGEVIMCEAVDDFYRWSSIGNGGVDDRSRTVRFVLTCSDVSLEALDNLWKIGNVKFAIKT